MSTVARRKVPLHAKILMGAALGIIAGIVAQQVADKDTLKGVGEYLGPVGNIFFFLNFFGDDEDNPLGAIGGLLVILIAPIAAGLLQLAVSRQREYLADATAARVLGTGEPLAQALETLERGVQAIPMQVNPATETLYIVNPFRGGGMTALFSTHPSLQDRIARLRAYDRNRGIV